MRQISFAILAIMFLTFLQSCEKKRQRIIRGQIINDSTKSPIEMTRFSLIVVDEETNVLKSSQIYLTEYIFSTDINGKFETSFEALEGNGLAIARSKTDYNEAKTLWLSSVRNKEELDIDAGIISVKNE